VKDPTLRPTAAQILQTPFFKNAKKGSYLVGTILRDLPPLAQRLERRKQATLLQHGTVDSWDFPTTLFLPSPNHSVYHRSTLDSPQGIDEQDEKENEPVTPQGGAQGSSGQKREQVAARSAESTHSQPPSKPSSGAGSLVTAALTSESLSTKIWRSVSLPTASATSVSAPVPPNQLATPNPSLWRRIRMSTGHSKGEARA